MSHPFQFIPVNKYVQVFIPLLGLTLLLTVVLWAIPLNPGIVQFELNAREVIGFATEQSAIASWNETDKSWAAFSLGLDFLYLVVYSTTISLACVWTANVLQTRALPLASVGTWLAWGQWLAALLDVVENLALVSILFGYGTDFSPQISKWCAITKFGLIALGLLYVGLGGVLQLKSSLLKQT
jgi:hypothetical protein